ncbi:MAG: hypothetical protein PHX13_11345 [Thiovulaceae bacterium]|nr:hypothetical protein [Sulfurimonadaceae bacterium]
MNETMQLIAGGVFFATLGVFSLWLKGMTRGTLSVVLGFLLTTVPVGVFFGAKYIFINGFLFGLVSMLYTGFVLLNRLNKECSRLMERTKQKDEELLQEPSSDSDNNLKEIPQITNKEEK